MQYYCTYFDREYLFRGLALYRSLERHSSSFILWVLCFDEVTHTILREMKLPGLQTISLEEFEEGDHKLLEAKKTRNNVEYYWTCTPSLPLYILRRNPGIDAITYLDADLFFFQDSLPLAQELGDASILILEHRYSPDHESATPRRGIYNVSVLSFRNDQNGLACLLWWRERCLEWCFNRVEDGKFGDQRYLDDWLSRFPNVRIVQNKGIGLAPWNISNYTVSVRNRRIHVDDDPLIIYHFHSLRIITRSLYDLADPSYKITREHAQLIYQPYMRELQATMREVNQLYPGFGYGYTPLKWYSRLGGVVLGRLTRRASF